MFKVVFEAEDAPFIITAIPTTTTAAATAQPAIIAIPASLETNSLKEESEDVVSYLCFSASEVFFEIFIWVLISSDFLALRVSDAGDILLNLGVVIGT